MHARMDGTGDALRRLLPAQTAPGKILDVGGTSRSARALRRLFPEATVTAINIRAAALPAVADHVVRVDVGDAEDPPYDDDSFDLVYAGGVLEHVVRPDRMLAAASRVLRNGGLLLGLTPNLAALQNRLFLLLGYSPTNYTAMPNRRVGLPALIRSSGVSGFGDHVRVFTIPALREVLSTPPWALVAVSGANAVSPDRPLSSLRRLLGVLPAGTRADITFCARNQKASVEQPHVPVPVTDVSR